MTPGSVLVTGATGFLGGAVCRRLARDGWRVTATGRNPAAGRTLWLGVSGSQNGSANASQALQAALANPAGLLQSKIAERDGVAAIFAHQIRFLADPADIALGISADGYSPSVLAGLEAAHDLGLLTIALAGGSSGPIMASKAVDHLLLAASHDPRVVKELQVTLYHLLWELVHVFFEQPGVLAPGVVT